MFSMLLWNHLFYPHIFSCYLEKHLQIFFLGLTVKARRAVAFLSWYFLTSLPEDRFDFTLHARTRCYFFFHKHVLVVFLFYCFQQKKKGEDAEFLFFEICFSDIVCIFS
jgi:hypothetical protein